MKLRRLSPSPITRWKLSKAMKGRKHTPEAKEKVRAANTGRKHTELTKEKMGYAQRRRRRVESAIGVVELCRRVARARNERVNAAKDRLYRADKKAAREMGNLELLRDVIQSRGFSNKRKLKDPTGRVSDGFKHPGSKYRFPGGGSYGMRNVPPKPAWAPAHDLRECKPVDRVPFWKNKQKGLAKKGTID